MLFTYVNISTIIGRVQRSKIKGEINVIFFRLDTGDDQRIDKEEFTKEEMKSVIEKVIRKVFSFF